MREKTAASVAIFLILASLPAAGREFEDQFGRTLEAKLVAHGGADSDTVTIQKPGGEPITVEPSVFSKKDQEFIREWMKETPPSLKGRFGSLSNGLLVRHEFEEYSGRDVPDQSGSDAAPSTLNFAPESVTGVIGKALLFDGVDDSLIVNSPTIGDTTDSSVSLWFKTKETRTRSVGRKRPALFGIITEGRVSGDISLYTSRGYLGAYHELAGAVKETSGELVADDKWHHAVLVVDSSAGVLVYLDGRLIITLPAPDRAIADRKLRVGSSNYHRAPNRWHQGAIDELMIWDRPLTAGEVRELHLLRYRKAR